ncbi:SWIM zinc finger family protein [Streptomyces sp. NPDC101219]|uniref:SWIM zinc finger family protein n=1 Tax=Streptomyces sp. NPDC101219 TaxID=3366131 RepID=UPI003816AF09
MHATPPGPTGPTASDGPPAPGCSASHATPQGPTGPTASDGPPAPGCSASHATPQGPTGPTASDGPPAPGRPAPHTTRPSLTGPDGSPAPGRPAAHGTPPGPTDPPTSARPAPHDTALGTTNPTPDDSRNSDDNDDSGAAPGRRPGDIAREALRSARQEALHARAEAGPRGDRPAPRRTPAPAPRLPRTSRGDRVADARARAVRDALADAFRMPPPSDADEPGGPGPRATAAGPPPTPKDDREVPAPPARDRSAGPARAPAAGGAPHTPRSMAAPARDGELRRTFPAFGPRADAAAGIADTWWGNAWVTALEEGALDAARLARGRVYAERGHVDAVTVTPGLVLAYVQGSRPRPYRVQVRLRTFEDAEWDRFLDAAAERPGHIAALLDKVMPQSLADCGVPLLPGPGDLAPRCSCPDSGHPCKHAAALCYATARLLDADPFVLLLLRGRGEREVIDDLSRRSAARAARDTRPEPLPGIRATEAFEPRALPPLPAPLPAPAHPEQPPVYPGVPGGPDAFALDQLATDAAARAHALLTAGRDPVGGLTLWQDAVRLAAARPGSGLTVATRALYSSLATAAGRTPAELARAVAAWRQGGPAGLEVLEESWDPPAGPFDRARPLLLAADLPAFRPWRNHLTHPRGHVQLRLGRDHLWYAYESEPGRDDWWPRGTPDPDPVGALTGMDAAAPL